MQVTERRIEVVRYEFVEFISLLLRHFIPVLMPQGTDGVHLFPIDRNRKIDKVGVFRDNLLHAIRFTEFLRFVFQLEGDLGPPAADVQSP